MEAEMKETAHNEAPFAHTRPHESSRVGITYVLERYAETPIPQLPTNVTSFDELKLKGRDASWSFIQSEAETVGDVIRLLVVPDIEKDLKYATAVKILSNRETLDATLRNREYESLEALKDASPAAWNAVEQVSRAHESIANVLLRYWISSMTDAEAGELGFSKEDVLQTFKEASIPQKAQ